MQHVERLLCRAERLTNAAISLMRSISSVTICQPRENPVAGFFVRSFFDWAGGESCLLLTF